MDSLPAEPQRNTTGHTDIHLKKKVEEEGHQVKSLGDSVYSHEKRRKVHHESVHCVLGNSSILNCWVAMTFNLHEQSRGGQGKQFFLERQSSVVLRRLGSAARLLSLHLTRCEPLIK